LNIDSTRQIMLDKIEHCAVDQLVNRNLFHIHIP